MSHNQPLPAEFVRPQVVPVSGAQIAEARHAYHQLVYSFALEGHEPDDFGKVVALEEIRGELTSEQAMRIMCEQDAEEVVRIKEKVQRLAELGLSWKNL